MKSSQLRNLGILFLALLAFSACRNPENEIQPTCFDEVLNQGELRVDCGGPNCPECQPSCDDKIANQDEQSPVLNGKVIGIDCGGENCPPCSTCEDGIQNAHWVIDPNLTQDDLGSADVAQSKTGVMYRLVMESGIDCGFPCPLVCVAPYTNDDGIMNGDEEGVDCGGSTDTPCPLPNCNDGIQNGTETGIDCGDMIEPSNCGPCPDPTCDDGIQNTHIELNPDLPAGYVVVVETGIDCDTQAMTSCPDCPIPTCFDGIQNGGETGVDCGGSCGTLCDPEPNCNNGIMDGDETGIDCDDDPLTPCPPCATCGDGIKNGPEFDVDCVDYPIPDYPCPVCPSCHDGIQNPVDDLIFELDVDCGGPNCEPCEQYLTVDLIGTAGPTGFVDQYTYNRLMAAGGNTDTLELDHNMYPGLKAEKIQNFGLGDPYLKITANQGFMTASNGLYVRTVTVYMRYPESIGLNGTDTIADLGTPSFGICEPIPISKLPFVVYKEKLVDSPNLLNVCMTSYEAPLNPDFPLVTENSVLTIDYLYGLPQASQYYTKGNIDSGSLHSKKLDGTMLEGTYENIRFAKQYSYY